MKNSHLFTTYKQFSDESESGFGIVLRDVNTNRFMIPIFEHFFQLGMEEGNYPFSYYDLQVRFFNHLEEGDSNKELTEFLNTRMTDRTREVFTSRLDIDFHYMFFIYDVDPNDEKDNALIKAFYDHDFTRDDKCEWLSLGVEGLSSIAHQWDAYNTVNDLATSYVSVPTTVVPDLFFETNLEVDMPKVVTRPNLLTIPAESLFHICLLSNDECDLKVVGTYNINRYIRQLIESQSDEVNTIGVMGHSDGLDNYIKSLLDNSRHEFQKDTDWWDSAKRVSFLKMTGCGSVVSHRAIILNYDNETKQKHLEEFKNTFETLSCCPDYGAMLSQMRYDIEEMTEKVHSYDVLAYQIAISLVQQEQRHHERSCDAEAEAESK